MARTCVFCGGRNLTLEHIWPQWLRRDPSTRRYAEQTYARDEIHFIRKRVVEPDGTSRSELVPRGLKIPTLNGTVKVVCATCNNGWMSALEVSTKRFISALMSGRRLVLNQSSLEAVSAWAFKTTAMFQFNDPPSRIITDEALNLFSQTRTPPPGVRIYIFRPLDATHDMTMCNRHLLRETVSGVGSEMSVTHLLLPGVGFATTFCKDLPDGIGMILDDRLIEIWPNTPSAIRWPADPYHPDEISQMFEVTHTSE